MLPSQTARLSTSLDSSNVHVGEFEFPCGNVTDDRVCFHPSLPPSTLLSQRWDFPFTTEIYGSVSWEDIRNSSDNEIKAGDRKLNDYFSQPLEERYDLENDPNGA
ncbi:hypothetical protein PISL3812_09721 [Talaromyces islandicus]|uniref:Uncharacterized protein n=1 Tax=Talaromyces islandicus TaxID=28573 RepID=A0A0U1MAN3_TALIS|nr:hypothetical protein PISL3812_09721 [Talaromyces islandicus]